MRSSLAFALLWFGCLLAARAPAAGQSLPPRLRQAKILVSDLENRTFDAEKNWIGQAVSYYVRETLKGTGEVQVLPHKNPGVNLFNGDLDHLVTGEFREETGSFVVTAILEDRHGAGDKRYLLTEGSSENILQMARYFTKRIAEELGLTLSPDQLAGTTWGATQSVQAFESFIKAIADRRLIEKTESYKRAIQLDKGFAAAHLHLGLVYVYAGHWKEAELSLTRAAQLLPGNCDVHNNLGYVYGRLGKLGPAESSFRLALRCRPDSVKFKMNLADTLKAKGQSAQALSVYREILAAHPGDREALEGVRGITTMQASASEASAHTEGPSPRERETSPIPVQAQSDATAKPQARAVEPAPGTAGGPTVEPPAPMQEQAAPAPAPPQTRRPVRPQLEQEMRDLETALASGGGKETLLRLIGVQEQLGLHIPARLNLLKAVKETPSDPDLQELLDKDKALWSELDTGIEAIRFVEPEKAGEVVQLLEASRLAFVSGDLALGYRNLGEYYFKIERYYSALVNLRMAVSKAPSDKEAHFYLAEVNTKLNREKEASKHYKLSGRQAP